MKKRSYLLVLIALASHTLFSCTAKEPNTNTTDPTQDEYITQDVVKSSPAAFYYSIAPALAKADTPEKKQSLGDSIYLIAKEKKWIPIVFADTAVFIYHHSSNTDITVKVFGDLNGWSESKAPQVSLTRYADTRLYAGIYKAPSTTTRIDYKLVVGSAWILDPGNTKLAWGGMGSNSEVALSEYEYSPWVKARSDINKGTLSANQLITSTALGYNINYRVYLPYGYDSELSYPVLFVTDGHEYISNNLGALPNVADNMLHENKIEPLIIVFVDPRDPTNGTNKRMTEYVANDEFVTFLADELYGAIAENYSIKDSPEQTAILGTSLGGLNSAYVGIKRSDVFGLLAIQSPALWIHLGIFDLYNGDKKNLKIYMDAGTIHDTQERAMELKTILENKSYTFQYTEYDEGHSWGNWRARMDDVLIYFFEK
ncbi:MAG: esterase family protein [Paludibacteraceae bacterium]|nr:esterase family protein [Paludibacteraceae bacterium]